MAWASIVFEEPLEMKSLHIVLLVAAGAIAGAVVMRVVQRPHADAVVAQTQERTPVLPVQPTPVSTERAPEPPPLRVVPRPIRVHPGEARTSRRIPQVVIAQYRPSAPATPVQEEPAPQPISLARPEPENATPPPPAPPPNRVTLSAGMPIPVRLVDGLSSERNMPGDTFIATLDKELVVDGFVIAERGARVEGRVVASGRGGNVNGVAGLAVELTRLRTSDGQNVTIQTDRFERRAEPAPRQDAEKVVAGAAIGAGVGGGAGDVLLTRGDAAKLPSETRISFRLRAPVTLTERTPL